MPTKEFLKKQIILLNIENDELFDRWEQADEMILELIDKLVVRTTKLKVAEGLSTKDWVAENKVYAAEAKIIREEMEKMQCDTDYANEIIDKQVDGAETRSKNSLKKYHTMLPFYTAGLIAGKSQNQAARDAHVKACEIDDTIPKKISDRQLSRELNKLLKDKHSLYD